MYQKPPEGAQETERERSQDGVVSVSTKSEALPIKLNFLVYYTVKVTIID
jgi:hypothetical protein